MTFALIFLTFLCIPSVYSVYLWPVLSFVALQVGACNFYKNVQKVNTHDRIAMLGLDAAWDIEDLITASTRRKVSVSVFVFYKAPTLLPPFSSIYHPSESLSDFAGLVLRTGLLYRSALCNTTAPPSCACFQRFKHTVRLHRDCWLIGVCVVFVLDGGSI